MRFTNEGKEVVMSARQILDKVQVTDLRTYDAGLREPGVEIVLDNFSSNIVNADGIEGMLVMHIEPFADVSILRYVNDGEKWIEEPVRIRDMKKKEYKSLFDFAEGYLMCRKQMLKETA